MTHLTFYLGYLWPIEKGLLPNSLTHLTLDGFEWMPGLIPGSLTHLTFRSGCLNQQIPQDFLPDSLTYLTFGMDFNEQNLPEELPSSLVSINIRGEERIQDFRDRIRPREQDAGSNKYYKYKKYKNKYL